MLLQSDKRQSETSVNTRDPIYMFHPLKARGASIRQVPVSATLLHGPQGPARALLLNHREAVIIPAEGRIYKPERGRK